MPARGFAACSLPAAPTPAPLPPRETPAATECHILHLHQVNDSWLPKETRAEPGRKQSWEREGREDRGKDTEMKSSSDLLCISSSSRGRSQSILPPSLLQPSVGLSASLSLRGLEFLGVRLGQQSCGNRFPSPGTPPSAQTAQLHREKMDGELCLDLSGGGS